MGLEHLKAVMIRDNDDGRLFGPYLSHELLYSASLVEFIEMLRSFGFDCFMALLC